jgi:hypothetical protein
MADGLDGLGPFQAAGGLTLYAPSPADAQAETMAHEKCQVFIGHGGVALREGARPLSGDAVCAPTTPRCCFR